MHTGDWIGANHTMANCQMWIANWSRTDYIMIIIQGWIDIYKGKYNSKYIRVDKMTSSQRQMGK